MCSCFPHPVKTASLLAALETLIKNSDSWLGLSCHCQLCQVPLLRYIMLDMRCPWAVCFVDHKVLCVVAHVACPTGLVSILDISVSTLSVAVSF